jgi:hypothetical protein
MTRERTLQMGRRLRILVDNKSCLRQSLPDMRNSDRAHAQQTVHLPLFNTSLHKASFFHEMSTRFCVKFMHLIMMYVFMSM